MKKIIYTVGEGKWECRARMQKMLAAHCSAEVNFLVDIRQSATASNPGNPGNDRCGPREWHVQFGTGVGAAIPFSFDATASNLDDAEWQAEVEKLSAVLPVQKSCIASSVDGEFGPALGPVRIPVLSYKTGSRHVQFRWKNGRSKRC